ncbi:insulin-like receptor [Drosophila novamexicana]|uniref:insulin-like receptor n=1 Tax=Drosophila novamexicana TaxID=47314 RepID=UPI0011E5C315|nr:insulin-like receptor [Drosophila novamexicana]
MLMLHCRNLFKRRRRQQIQPQHQQQQLQQQQQQQLARRVYPKYSYHQEQHHHWRHQSIAYAILALLTLHATTTIALQPPPTQYDQQQQHQQRATLTAKRSLEYSLASLTGQARNIGPGVNSNSNINRDVRLARREMPCKSMDIRNNISELSQLANCTIIEGFLLITLINDADKLNTSYPLLTEVTGYIIVYRVHNLISLSQIFPNLSVIRGNILFESYAFIVYQNKDLLDIGLSNLRAITNGGVRIEKNYYLCFVKTVNWQKIVSKNATESDIVLKFNRNEAECARCPGETKGDDTQDSTMTDASDMPVCKIHPDNKRYCWSNRACQTICPKECPYNCIDENTCCNDSCLGSCSKPVLGDCVACRNVSIHGGNCINQCPDGYFLYEQRCITAEMCERMGTKYESSKEMKLVHYNGKCTTRCEKGYSTMNNTCQKCNGTCQKLCQGGIIDSLVRAKEFHGCTVIGNDGLTISIKRGGPHMVDALVSGLGMVHTINSYLKVHLTYGLTTLDFFKSLRHIKGDTLLEGRYALYVLENRDLEAIWGENQTVSISNGSIFFHFNPKLCIETIDKLRPMLPGKPEKFNKNEVAEDSNGNKGTCNTILLKVNINKKASTLVVINIITTVEFDDDRSFIGYQIYHTSDPYGNVTRDNYQPCLDSWIVSEPSKDTSSFIGNLLPYTKYAFYVRTMTISSEKRNYQSDIIRFQTMPTKPTDVRRISARSTDSSKILLSWKPPLNVNGKLVKYQVRAEITRRDAKLEHHRNFCRDPLPNSSDDEETFSSPAEKTIMETPGSDCKCDAGGRNVFDQQDVEEKIFDEIEFENALQNFLYVSKKRDKLQQLENEVALTDNSIDGTGSFGSPNALQRRRRRYIEVDEDEHKIGSALMRQIGHAKLDNASKFESERPKPNGTADNSMESWSNMTVMDESESYYRIFSAEVDANTTEFQFEKLRHFSLYSLSVRACREKEGVNDTADVCSDAEPWEKRTRKLANMDKAFNLTGELLGNLNTTRGNVRLRWEEPLDPNGAIVSYMIIYERQERDAVEEKRCITVQDYLNQSGYVVTNLNEGKYSFRIRANSLAGEGDLTDFVYVTVPPPGLSPFEWAGYTLIGIMGIIVCLLIYYKFFRAKKGHPRDLVINTEVNPFYASLQYVPDDWEVPRERIIQLGPLGQGSFGMVYEGILKAQNTGEDIPCAIKTVNENATDRERTNFLSEASVMKEFDTYHVVRLLGVCSCGQPALVVMELMKKGDLKSYLRAHRPDEREDVLAVYQQRIGLTTGTGTIAGAVQPPPYSRIFQMAIEIADGMAYLAAKKFVHRDLAARNCMVAEDLTVKIGDFGMTRDIYETDYYRKGTKGLLPVRWMPPESLRDGVYASSSDVFSYGVVLWEMATLASQPYQGLSNEQVLRYVIDGGIMERPDNCPEVLHKLMHRCWHHRPSARPSFLDIIAYLEGLAHPHFKEVAFYYTDAGVQYREKERKERNQIDAFASAHLDADVDGEDATTPLRVGEYEGYKSNMEHNESVEQPAESPIALVDDQATTHSPFSMQSGYIVSSTPDASCTLPTAGGSHLEDAAYVQPDVDSPLNQYGERGYEPYDPSPNFVELVPSNSGRLSGEQHLLPKTKRSGGASIIPNMSSSMPDEVIGGGASGSGSVVTSGVVSSSLQPSTASAASSNASSSRNPSLKRVVADTLRNRVGYGLLSRFNLKRGDSNDSHKSNISNAASSSSNSNLTSHPAGMAMVSMGPNLGTIESGGSGSAGSYAGTPRFYTPTATTPSAGGNGSTIIMSDNSNYKLLDESGNSADAVNSSWPQNKLTTSSLNPNYELMQAPATETGATPFSMISDNPNYVLMSEPKTATGQGQVFTSDNPNYAAMTGPAQVQPSSSDQDENDDEDDADEHTEHIKMERMPLSRQKQRTRIKPQQQQQQHQQPRSRSVSQTRKAETSAPTSAATAAAAAAAASAAKTSNILKENWLRQASTPKPPPPNGFIGREA